MNSFTNSQERDDAVHSTNISNYLSPNKLVSHLSIKNRTFPDSTSAMLHLVLNDFKQEKFLFYVERLNTAEFLNCEGF